MLVGITTTCVGTQDYLAWHAVVTASVYERHHEVYGQNTMIVVLLVFLLPLSTCKQVVINTWHFSQAAQKAWDRLQEAGSDVIDAVEAGCTKCEQDQCDGTVGYGGSPDENGETTLDAMIMDGQDLNVGAVAALRGIKNAVGVARAVLEHTQHSLLAGELAAEFAVQMGFTKETLETPQSHEKWEKWKEERACQPNFWTDVTPDPTKTCGPYHPSKEENGHESHGFGASGNHDTIGMVVLDHDGRMAAGTSTNGAVHKIPGRVGDSPIVGAGAYVDASVGGAAATGDGDIMMRLLPSFRAVQAMQSGLPPALAAQEAITPIIKHYPKFIGAVVALSKDGTFGAACHGIPKFEFSVVSDETDGKVVVASVPCQITEVPPKSEALNSRGP